MRNTQEDWALNEGVRTAIEPELRRILDMVLPKAREFFADETTQLRAEGRPDKWLDDAVTGLAWRAVVLTAWRMAEKDVEAAAFTKNVLRGRGYQITVQRRPSLVDALDALLG